jgi:hypothetical protein
MIYAELMGNHKSWEIKSSQDNKLKEMLYARCLAKGANRIGADLLLGLYTAEEMADTFIQNENQIKRHEDGSIAEIVDIPHQEVKTT